ncbi:MAG: 50S ribosomal protein L23 [Cryomorphaceae bacterium]|jgi:large subunit ribosomal protein L23|nr:MAG: 50S ribosomal protein L23 [Cryomorphaceae bacterium BACL7 MAG-121220-bin83]NQW26061.1 50S ribosomal protein L23 [Cryomorphaceae bacterium]
MESILIRPVITEKASAEAEGRNRYTFVVAKKANKIEIKKAVEATYNVKVDNVRTIIVPAKHIVRQTKAGMLEGKKSSYKKAIVDVRSGESIDIYGNL